MIEEHEVNADDDKRYAEPLSHVQPHAVFEGYLILLQEFDEETEDKYFRQAKAEEEAAGIGQRGIELHGRRLALRGAEVGLQFVFLLFLSSLIEVEHAQRKDEVGDGFVKLCRMTGNRVYPLEYERPGDVGRHTDDFGVHQVGQTDAAGSDGGGYGNHVEYVHVVHLCLAAVEPQGNDEAQRSAVTGKACIAGKLPSAVGQELDGKYHFPEVVQIVFGLVEQAVPQTRTYQNAEKAVEEQWVEEAVGYFTVAVLPAYDEIGKGQADNPQESVVADGDAEKVEQFGIGIPVDAE